MREEKINEHSIEEEMEWRIRVLRRTARTCAAEAKRLEREKDAMRDSKLQLVIPSQLFPTYTPSQQDWLMDVGGFCEMVEERQRALD